MSKQTMIVLSTVVVVAVLGAGVYAFTSSGDQNTNDSAQPQSQTTNNPATTPQGTVDTGEQSSETTEPEATTTVVFTDDGFNQDQYRIRVGWQLEIVNNSSQNMQFSSDDHPTHRLNSELNAPVIAAGQSTTLQPTTVGTFGIHDHIRSQFTTKLIVTE